MEATTPRVSTPRPPSSMSSPRRRHSVSMRRSARMLLQEGQSHLFENWPPPGENDDEKLRFSEQVEKLDAKYPGGLVAYLQTAKKLLAGDDAATHPFDGYIPSAADGERLQFGRARFGELEAAGAKESGRAAFVLIAGGFAQRLGYSGIKLALPAESTTGTCFLELYIQHILALQESAAENSLASGDAIPLAIMTSDGTHDRIQELLNAKQFFGMRPDQIQLLKQDSAVACVDPSTGNLVLDPSDPFLIKTMPRGPGDVHAVLFASGLLQKWQAEGRQWVILFEESNGLTFKAMPALLGASVARDWDVNLLAGPRKGKTPGTGIVQFTHPENGSRAVATVDRVHAVLTFMGYASLDINDLVTEHSPLPAALDQMVLKLEPYLEELSRTKGVVVHDVFPLFEEETSVRLECRMQDYTRSLGPSAKVGLTILDNWLTYAPVRNRAELAAKMSERLRHSPASSEMAIYKANCLVLREAGVSIEEAVEDELHGQTVEVWPRIVWHPRWALTVADVRKKMLNVLECSSITQRSTLVLQGKDITIDNLHLDGALVVRAALGTHVTLQNVRVENEGWRFVPTDENGESGSDPEAAKIRGFRVKRQGQTLLQFDKGGLCCVANVTLNSFVASDVWMDHTLSS